MAGWATFTYIHNKYRIGGGDRPTFVVASPSLSSLSWLLADDRILVLFGNETNLKPHDNL
jgi:hypothetical protein